MELEIIKTMNGYYCVEKDNGQRKWSFESDTSLFSWLKDFLPSTTDAEVKLTN